MRIGVNLPQYAIDFEHGVAAIDAVAAYAATADDAGVASLWVSDHPFVVAPDGSRWDALDPVDVLEHVAGVTSSVRLGTLVLAASRRGPDGVARAAERLSRVAPGRVVLGLGAGWYEPEFRAEGKALPPWEERARILEESASITAGVEVLIGGTSNRVLALAARAADAWNVAWDVPVDVYRALSARLDDECARAGRDPAAVRRTVGVTVLVADERDGLDEAVARVRERASFLRDLTLDALRDRIIVGIPDEVQGRLRAYGADEVIVTPFVRDDPAMVRALATLARTMRARQSGDGSS